MLGHTRLGRYHSRSHHFSLGDVIAQTILFLSPRLWLVRRRLPCDTTRPTLSTQKWSRDLHSEPSLESTVVIKIIISSFMGASLNHKLVAGPPTPVCST
jgi:hypothetical protein